VENPRVIRSELGIFPNLTMHLHVHWISPPIAVHRNEPATADDTMARTSPEYTPSNHNRTDITRMGTSVIAGDYSS